MLVRRGWAGGVLRYVVARPEGAGERSPLLTRATTVPRHLHLVNTGQAGHQSGHREWSLRPLTHALRSNHTEVRPKPRQAKPTHAVMA